MEEVVKSLIKKWQTNFMIYLEMKIYQKLNLVQREKFFLGISFLSFLL
jgi:hypothetical protein